MAEGWTLFRRERYPRFVQVWGGAMPVDTLPEAGQVFIVPFGENNILRSFYVNRINFRLETPGSTDDTTVELQKSPGGDAPVWTTFQTITLTAGSYQDEGTGSPIVVVASGDLLRVLWTAVDADAASPLIQMEGQA